MSRETRQPKQNQVTEVDGLICGLYSKREAAALIGEGARHVHSSVMGTRDVCAKITQERLTSGMDIPYPWETATADGEILLRNSKDRHSIITNLIADAGIQNKRDLREKVQSVLEELVTNAIYHAYRGKNGSEKYSRRDAVTLTEAERVLIRYRSVPEGIYLCVGDQGGSLQFKTVSGLFQRCYGNSTEQIETKDGGAGLGVYMIFEAVTHLSIVALPGKSTSFSCWIADKGSFDRDVFSFNYFEGR